MYSCTSPSGIEVSLNKPEIWEKFYPKTEMIVTRKRGRVIFPHLDYNVKGLDPDSLYSIYIHLERVDGIKYKFDAGEWKEAGKGDPILPIQYKEHPRGKRTGTEWMSEPVSFAHLKITNDPENKDQKLILAQSLHKYIPVLHIKQLDPYKGTFQMDFHGVEFRLEATQFIVVTAYQNEELTKLKVHHNKFASGFRSNGKRRLSSESENSENSPPKRSASAISSLTPPAISPPMDYTQQNPYFFNQNFFSTPQSHQPQFAAHSANAQNYNNFGAQNGAQFDWNVYYQRQWYWQQQMMMSGGIGQPQMLNNGFPNL
ncbi:T-box protein 37 [Caenorhabditis elegans]|uniref:T-box protein 37 n=1 Tax=Caenorhabditis elegans TaxID=6239 RepID=TBX37_CAEEL|nr:T-box protein 37 [Caenorhabditis elegans]Q9U2C9.2 RecName: Full=T-box protein 37 [Caenorhabditis elegans]CAB57892.2 T-box protein 37 [Caenorhabditis elegans]|eukprot:NP_499444.2 Putative T-box protein 37 [Caenorhabditis elegans]